MAKGDSLFAAADSSARSGLRASDAAGGCFNAIDHSSTGTTRSHWLAHRACGRRSTCLPLRQTRRPEPRDLIDVQRFVWVVTKYREEAARDGEAEA